MTHAAFPPGTGLNLAPGNVEINALHGRPPRPGRRRAPASGQRPRVPVVVDDRPLFPAGVARIVTERAVLAWVECAQLRGFEPLTPSMRTLTTTVDSGRCRWS